METKNFADLLADPDNPRDISEHDFKHLVESLQRFGDLSGIVFNVTTGMLVGGHQRRQAFEAMGGSNQVQILTRFEQPDKQGTVALGYIENEGAKYSYREVAWDANTQRVANIAANRIRGKFNLEKLAENNYKILQSGDEGLLKLTGQSDTELKQLLNSVGVGEPEPEDAPQDPKITLSVVGHDSEQMTTLYHELKERGLQVRLK